MLERKCRQAPCLGISVRMFINNTDKLDKERTDLWWGQVSVIHYAATGGRENARKFVHDKVLFGHSEEPTELWQDLAGLGSVPECSSTDGFRNWEVITPVDNLSIWDVSLLEEESN